MPRQFPFMCCLAVDRQVPIPTFIKSYQLPRRVISVLVIRVVVIVAWKCFFCPLFIYTSSQALVEDVENYIPLRLAWLGWAGLMVFSGAAPAMNKKGKRSVIGTTTESGLSHKAIEGTAIKI